MIQNNFLDAVSQKDLLLTRRQIQVLQMSANGLKNNQIAYQLGICEQAVKNHKFNACRRLGCPGDSSTVKMIAYLWWRGVIV